MDIKGKIVEIYDTVQVSEKFKKREFVVEYAENSQYPEYIKFELTQDKCDVLNGFRMGQDIEVQFNLKGRKWTDPKGETKYFNSLQAWKVQSAGNKAPENVDQSFSSQSTTSWSSNEEENDLPF
ncbi:MAG: DUF3127 domain-containing protein [Bacteroidota bacterium]|jgi:hypothetical protein|nr:DUF3127 domain-containing protein [Bacteroidota bacterium]